MTTNAESFNTGLLNSEKHNITSKQSSSFSAGLPVISLVQLQFKISSAVMER